MASQIGHKKEVSKGLELYIKYLQGTYYQSSFHHSSLSSHYLHRMLLSIIRPSILIYTQGPVPGLSPLSTKDLHNNIHHQRHRHRHRHRHDHRHRHPHDLEYSTM